MLDYKIVVGAQLLVSFADELISFIAGVFSERSIVYVGQRRSSQRALELVKSLFELGKLVV